MFRNLKDFVYGRASLEVDKSGQPTTRELQVATVALLWEMAYADENLKPEEFIEVVLHANRQLNLMDDEVGEFIELIDFIRRDKKKICDFIDKVNNHFNAHQRKVVLDLTWKIAKSDGHVHESEVALLEKLQKRLNLGESELEAA